MDRPRSMKALLVCFILLVCPLLVRGQVGNQASIDGVITDPAGAVVPGAAVRARNLQTSATFHISTSEDGFFRFPVLPVGTYELIAEHAGFAPLTVKDLVVTVGAKIHMPLTLRLATHAESVVVEDDPPLLETTRTAVSATVGSRAISELPVHGREFISFVLLTPGVTNDVRGGLSFAGQRAMNSLLVDGVDENDSFFDQPLGGEGFSNPTAGTSQYHVSQDAVQEFQVNSNSYSVEFGRASGGVTNAVTKSGTNEFHGSAYWFYRDHALNATDFVNNLNGQPKDPFHFNQFGGTVGGPIRRNKLFFFFNYEGLRSKKANPVFLNLPAGFQLSSDAIRAGFQQRALDYLEARAFSWVLPFRQDVYLAKFDWKVTPAHWLAGRWVRQRLDAPGSSGAQASLENSVAGFINGDLLSASLTSTRSPSVTNAFRFSYIHEDVGFAAGSANPLANIFEGGQLVLTIGRANGTPQRNRLDRIQLSDTLSYVHGRHTWKMGADALLDSNAYLNAQNFVGNYRFLSLESFGRSLAGVPAPLPGEQYLQGFSGEGTPGADVDPNVHDFAAFIEDEWRLRPNLTLNLGLRYDLQVSARSPVKNPSPALAAAGIDTSALPTDKNNFAPRVGLAWSPLSNQRLVVRAGYGIFYSPTIALQLSRAHLQNGITVQLRTFRPGTPSAALIPAYPNNFCGPPDPSALAPSCAPPSTGASNPIIMPFARDHVEPYVQQGSLGIEVELQKDLTISTTYLVAKGTHLAQTRDVNLGLPQTPAQIGIAGTTTILHYEGFTLPRPIAGFDRILVYESDANSIYHGLAAQVTKRFSHNFQFLGSYTFGKVIDDNPNQYVGSTGADALLVADPSDRRADRGPGSNDQRHRFVLSGIWELNYASGLSPTPRALLEDWQLSGILAAQSGHTYSGLVPFDLNTDGNNASDRTPALGRDTFYLPATVSLDLRVTRTIRLGESMRLLLNAEAFNILNHGNITSVRTTQFTFSSVAAVCGIAGTPCLVPQTSGLTAFETPTATSGPRIIQLSIKFLF